MARNRLTTEFYVQLSPIYGRGGSLTGVKAEKLSQRAPRKGHCVQLRLSVPSSAFAPFRAELEVPEMAMQCKVTPINEEVQE